MLITKHKITEQMPKLRAIATITVYVYGETNTELLEEANKKTKTLNNNDDCNATLDKLQLNKFGSLDLKDI